jgi:hypothetical protein
MDDNIQEVKLSLPEKQIEQLILKKFYTDNEYRNFILNHYQDRYLFNQDIAVVVNILIQYYHTYNDVPSKPIMEMIVEKYGESNDKVDSKKLLTIFNNALEIDVAQDDDFIKSNILGFIQNRASYFVIMEELETIDKYGDVSTCITKLQSIIDIGFDTDLGLNYMEDLNKHFEEMANPELMLSTGYKSFDYVTNGGFPTLGKALIVFMAQSGIGKSLMLSNLAVNVMQRGLKPVIISLEMPEFVYAKRIDAHISGMDINALQFNIDTAMTKIKGWHQLNSNGEGGLIIKDYPPSSVNANNIKSYLDRVKSSGYDFDIVFIDYLNLMNTNTKSSNQGMYERVGDISREVRALSYHFKVPFVSATQSNRSGWDTSDVSMAHVSESAGIVHTVDYLGVLWQQDGDREANRLNHTVLKNRFGGMVGKNMEQYIDYTNLKITDMERTDEESLSIAEELDNDLNELEEL